MPKSIFRYVLMTAALFQITNITSSACTSFVIYSTNIYYGMNFDWPNTEMKYCIEKSGSIKYFHFQFVKYGYFSTTAGMNERGIFSSIQMLHPEVSSWTTNGITLWDVFPWMMSGADSANTLLTYLNGTNEKIIHIYGTTLHDIFADKFGKAFVLEVGENDNKVTNAENGMLVMTNFENHKFIGENYQNVYGTGADRYKAAYEHILQNKADFDFNDGMETLKRSVQTSSSTYPTQCSMLFDPGNNSIYIVIRRDFNKIWKLSLDDETIETYSGFNNYSKFSIGSSGILASELLNAASSVDLRRPLPDNYQLSQNYPNPFNPTTNFEYRIPNSEFVSLIIYDLLGRKVTTLVNGTRSPGIHTVEWNGTNSAGQTVSSGIYFCRLQADRYTQIKKITLIK